MAELKGAEAELSSQLLIDLVTPGRVLPDFAGPLAELLDATDWEEAIAQGRVVPKEVCQASPEIHELYMFAQGYSCDKLSLRGRQM